MSRLHAAFIVLVFCFGIWILADILMLSKLRTRVMMLEIRQRTHEISVVKDVMIYNNEFIGEVTEK